MKLVDILNVLKEFNVELYTVPLKNFYIFNIKTDKQNMLKLPKTQNLIFDLIVSLIEKRREVIVIIFKSKFENISNKAIRLRIKKSYFIIEGKNNQKLKIYKNYNIKKFIEKIKEFIILVDKYEDYQAFKKHFKGAEPKKCFNLDLFKQNLIKDLSINDFNINFFENYNEIKIYINSKTPLSSKDIGYIKEYKNILEKILDKKILIKFNIKIKI